MNNIVDIEVVRTASDKCRVALVDNEWPAVIEWVDGGPVWLRLRRSALSDECIEFGPDARPIVTAVGQVQMRDTRGREVTVGFAMPLGEGSQLTPKKPRTPTKPEYFVLTYLDRGGNRVQVAVDPRDKANDWVGFFAARMTDRASMNGRLYELRNLRTQVDQLWGPYAFDTMQVRPLKDAQHGKFPLSGGDKAYLADRGCYVYEVRATELRELVWFVELRGQRSRDEVLAYFDKNVEGQEHPASTTTLELQEHSKGTQVRRLPLDDDDTSEGEYL